MKTILAVAVVSTLAACAVFVSLWYLQSRGIYRFKTTDVLPQDVGVSQMSLETFVSGDGTELRAWITPPDDGKPVILSFYGNYSSIDIAAARLKPLVEQGFGVAIMEWRRTPHPSERELAQDALAFYRQLDEMLGQNVPAASRVLHGFSLGGVFAAKLAVEADIAGLVVEAVGPNAPTYYGTRWHGLPIFKLMWRERLEADKAVAVVEVPKLFMHGRNDQAYPLWQGQALFDAAAEPKELVVFDDGSHHDLADHGALERIAEFALRVTQ